jgi:hypothetical protein
MDGLHLRRNHEMPNRTNQIRNAQTASRAALPPTRRFVPAAHGVDVAVSIVVQAGENGWPGSDLARLAAAFFEAYGGGEVGGL